MAGVCCAYIEQNLLAATSTASAQALMGPAACYTEIMLWAESVGQNCVLGRCATLCFNHSATVLILFLSLTDWNHSLAQATE